MVHLDASYRAIPWEPLLARANLDVEFAEALQFFHEYATATVDTRLEFWATPLHREVAEIAHLAAEKQRGILYRRLYTPAWDAVLWLLSPQRRASRGDDYVWDLPEFAVFGEEELACGAKAEQGWYPLRFVRPETADLIAEYIHSRRASARRLFNHKLMSAGDVYRAPRYRDYALETVAKYAQLYRMAADHGECVFVALD